VEFSIIAEPFDRYNSLAVGFEGWVVTGQDWQAVHHNGTDPALGFVAANFRSGQIQPLAEDVGQHFARLDLKFILFPIHPEGKCCHLFTSPYF
jgi:hypothetical protein